MQGQWKFDINYFDVAKNECSGILYWNGTDYRWTYDTLNGQKINIQSHIMQAAYTINVPKDDMQILHNDCGDYTMNIYADNVLYNVNPHISYGPHLSFNISSNKLRMPNHPGYFKSFHTVTSDTTVFFDNWGADGELTVEKGK